MNPERTEFPARRLGDEVSPANERVYDAARALTVALRLVDKLGLHILCVEADERGRQRIQVAPGPCTERLRAELAGVVTHNGNRHYRAERYGVEIVWVELGEAAAPTRGTPPDTRAAHGLGAAA